MATDVEGIKYTQYGNLADHRYILAEVIRSAIVGGERPTTGEEAPPNTPEDRSRRVTPDFDDTTLDGLCLLADMHGVLRPADKEGSTPTPIRRA